MDKGELHEGTAAHAVTYGGRLPEVQVAIKFILTHRRGPSLKKAKGVSKRFWEYTSNLLMNTIHRFSWNGHHCGGSYTTRTL